eukprot:74762_1
MKQKLTQIIANIDELSMSEFVHESGIKGDLSNVLNNESMVDILSQFIRNELNNNNNAENEAHKDDVEWKVSVEFTPTSIMSHLKPIDIICISLDDDLDTIDGYVVVLFENGVIASYIIQRGTETQYQSGASAALLPNGAIDFWLGTCIDWIELMFLMSFAAYFVCSCCRRSSLRIGLGRERVMNAAAPAAAVVGDQRPRRGALDVVNNDPLQPIQNNRPPLRLNDAADPAEEEEKGDGGDQQEVNANQRAIEAAMQRFLSQNQMEDEEEKEAETIIQSATNVNLNQNIFDTQNNNNNNDNGVDSLGFVAVNGPNNNDDDSSPVSPLSSLSPALD